MKIISFISYCLLICFSMKHDGTFAISFDESEDQPIDESFTVDDMQAVKESISSLNLNEKIRIDEKNPKLKELQKMIEKTLKKKKKEMEEEEKKKSDDKVINLKPNKDDDCKDSEKVEKEDSTKSKNKNEDK